MRGRKKCLHEIQLRAIYNCKTISISDQWERVQPVVGEATAGWIILGSVRKQAEQASKQHPSMASVSAPASRFQTCLCSRPSSLLVANQSKSQINPFLPNFLFFGDGICCSNRNPNKETYQSLDQAGSFSKIPQKRRRHTCAKAQPWF